MRRRDFTISLLLAAATAKAWAQGPAKPHRIAIVRPTGPITLISDTGIRSYRAFFEELRRLGDVEGQNLIVDRYSAQGRPEPFADLARDIVNRKPEVIVVSSDEIALAARAADDMMPILVWTGGDPVRAGLVKSLARPRKVMIMVKAGAAVDAVIDVHDAPVPKEPLPVGAAETGAAAVIDIEHRNTAARPELGTEIERARRRGRWAAMTFNKQGRPLVRICRVVGIVRRIEQPERRLAADFHNGCVPTPYLIWRADRFDHQVRDAIVQGFKGPDVAVGEALVEN